MTWAVFKLQDHHVEEKSFFNPDNRFRPSYIAQDGVERYEGISYTFDASTGKISWLDLKHKLKSDQVIAIHYQP